VQMQNALCLTASSTLLGLRNPAHCLCSVG
jgi:hypothetical protein